MYASLASDFVCYLTCNVTFGHSFMLIYVTIPFLTSSNSSHQVNSSKQHLNFEDNLQCLLTLVVGAVKAECLSVGHRLEGERFMRLRLEERGH